MNIFAIIYLILVGISLLIQAHRHGKPKEGKENFWVTFIATIITLMLLYFGGLFN